MYSCTKEGSSGHPTWAHVVSVAHGVTVGAILSSRQLGRPYCPVAAERLGTGRLVAA